MQSQAQPDWSAVSPVEDILARCLALPETERADAIEEEIVRRPELAAELRERVETLRALGIELFEPTPDFPPQIGEYRLIHRLGGGGMGVVFLAEQTSLKREVALKLIRPERLYFADSRARFRREAEAVARLQHPGIVPIIAVGDEQGNPYFAMQRIRGCTLAEALRALRGRAPESLRGADLHRVVSEAASSEELLTEGSAFDGTWIEACVRIAHQVADALAHAHERGLVHRDVKPSNILLTPDGRAMLIDFGLARAEHAEDQTRTGSALGTLHYMSPEHLRGGKEVDERSDVYSLGVTLYEMLALQLPYRGGSWLVIERLVLDGRPDSLRARNRRVEADVETVVLCAFDRDPSRRYASAGDFARDLSHLLAHRPIEAQRPGALLRARRWLQRHPVAGTALVLGPALVLGASATIVVRERSHSRATRELAARERASIMRLSAIQALADLETEADQLWPALPEKLEALSAWRKRAEALVAGLPEHRAMLAEIRSRAIPLTPEQVEADRRSSAGFSEWEKERSRLTWMRRMLGEEVWPREVDIAAELANESLPADANSLNELAWPLVDPDPEKIVYGTEGKGLVLARRAMLAEEGHERARARNTLAWALYRCGRFDEALDEGFRALEEAPENEQAELGDSLERMEERVGLWKTEGGRASQVGEAAKLALRAAELERAIDERRTYDFVDVEDRWLHAQLSKLVSDLLAFTDEESGGLFSAGTSEAHGWGIVKRAEFARTIGERSVEGPDARKRWDEAIAAIAASPRYGGLALSPQVGLLPIGEDPDSRLWEFAHLATGEPAERGVDGKLTLNESTGLVLVLIPGGTFHMGAQRSDPSGSNYDSRAEPSESPVHEVELAAYFLSKYEMTQGQWLRFTAFNPSAHGPLRYFSNWNRAGKGWSPLHPVEHVTWTQCVEVTSRLGLSLPSEAQWENGARGESDSAYWTGADVVSLRDAANLADSYAKTHGNEAWPEWEKDLDDGETAHAEVGSYRSNPFGLHDVHGNVWEWCLDGFESSWYSRGPHLDPVCPSSNGLRIIRGGSYSTAALNARSALRRDIPEYQKDMVGLRPARIVTNP
jgi:serine/threonine protein kinase/formylglycine-generating enzyme required for sulfatase activity